MAAACIRSTRFARLAVLISLCLPALAFQTGAPDDGPLVAIEPRLRTKAVVPGDSPKAHLRVDFSLVVIPAHVTNSAGTTVTNLKADNFRLFEEGVEQKITYFAQDDAPISIGLVLDTSGSMHNKMKKSSEAAATFFKTANREDEFFLVEFNDRPKLVVPFTANSDDLYDRIVRTRTVGRTSLFDAIHLALVQMKYAKNLRKAIVILSDGGDNRSRYTAREIKSALLECDVQVYAMGIYDPDDVRKRTPEERNGPQLLDELTEQTGGRHFPVENLNELPDISARIGMELRNQYLLGYTPTDEARDGKYRKVKVDLVDTRKLKIYYRQGYYAAAQ